MVTGNSRHALSLKLRTPDKKTMNAFLIGLIKVFSSWLSLCVPHGHPWAMIVIREVDILIGQTWVTCPHHPSWLHGMNSPQVRWLLLSEDERDAMLGIYLHSSFLRRKESVPPCLYSRKFYFFLLHCFSQCALVLPMSTPAVHCSGSWSNSFWHSGA